MRKIVYAALAVIISGCALTAQEPAPVSKLTTEQSLRVEVQKLKEQVLQLQVAEAQCRANLADVTARLDTVSINSQIPSLQEAHKTLEDEIKKALGGTDTDTLDWTTTPPSLKKTNATPTTTEQK